MRYYIASPFFDDFSKSWVESKEEEFKGFNIPFFSPRQDGVNFNKEGLTPELRAHRIRGIFNNNIKELENCTNIVCNLNYCRGKIDIGTLFELGYFVGMSQTVVTDKNNFIDCPKEFKVQLERFVDNLCYFKPVKENGTILNISQHHERSLIDETLKFWGLDSRISVYVIEDRICYGDRTLFLLDDFHYILILSMGLFYQRQIPFYTCSFRGFGSNVMIAASSKGHIQIPGFVDDTYKRDLL